MTVGTMNNTTTR